MEEKNVKQCCAAFYGSDVARFLLGDSFHPGGTKLTHEIAERLHLGPASRVLDAATGRGTSALYVAEMFGCEVVGVDLSEHNITLARQEAATRGLDTRVRFELSDAESLSFPECTFDAVLCECAFCTFPDKTAAAGEFYRVLRPGGCVGISDLTKAAGPLPGLEGLLAWIACIGDAQPLNSYANWLKGANFEVTETHDRSECLDEMVKQTRGQLLLAEVMIGLKKLDAPGLDIQQAKEFAQAASIALHKKQLGYAVLIASKPIL